MRISDLDLGHTPGRDVSSVLIHGKGNKRRRCPLWTRPCKVGSHYVCSVPESSKNSTG